MNTEQQARMQKTAELLEFEQIEANLVQEEENEAIRQRELAEFEFTESVLLFLEEGGNITELLTKIILDWAFNRDD